MSRYRRRQHSEIKLAFIVTSSGNQEFWERAIRDLWVKSLDDGTETFLAGGDDFSRFAPNWSSDGLRLVYTRFRPRAVQTDPPSRLVTESVRGGPACRNPTARGYLAS